MRPWRNLDLNLCWCVFLLFSWFCMWRLSFPLREWIILVRLQSSTRIKPKFHSPLFYPTGNSFPLSLSSIIYHLSSIIYISSIIYHYHCHHPKSKMYLILRRNYSSYSLYPLICECKYTIVLLMYYLYFIFYSL